MEVHFPDGTIVRATPLRERRETDDWRDCGLYLDPGWQPTWPADLIDWPDFGVPAFPEKAAEQIVGAFQQARSGAHLEIGCRGAIGRTGTVLACMAVLAGVRPDQAVDWVRASYHPMAVETAAQRDWVRWFAAYTGQHATPD